MAQIADALARVAGRPVMDRTGMDGRFFYNLNYSPLSAEATSSAADSGPPDFFVAVQQQLGGVLDKGGFVSAVRRVEIERGGCPCTKER